MHTPFLKRSYSFVTIPAAVCAVVLIAGGCGPDAGDQAGTTEQNGSLPAGQPQITPAKKVSDAEMKKFMTINQKFQMMQMDMQKQLHGFVTDEGLSPQRFNEIARAQQPGASGDSGISDTEQEKFDSIDEKMQGVQKDMQSESEKIITESGMEPERYQRVGMALQQKPELQTRYRELMMEEMKNRAPQAAPGMPPSQR